MASTKKTVLIIGSTRGIGLAFVEHYTKAGWNVIGTARANSNTEKLKALAPFKTIAMDTSDETSILEAARQLEGQPIDLLINNAGIGIPCELETGTKDALMNQFESCLTPDGPTTTLKYEGGLGEEEGGLEDIILALLCDCWVRYQKA
ncbi:hypothetical protein PC112_g15730 [Phytophthora cactorum]|nr:hypothetical protein PC112_g15730 [Phytophthora cactorum]